MSEQLEFRFDTQMLIDHPKMNEDEIRDYITKNFKGDCLIAVGDEETIKIHFHTNEPWLVLAFAASIGDLYDIVVENMQRQEDGLKG
jgi:dihydroxyacetone kinase-like predicted kinase